MTDDRECYLCGKRVPEPETKKVYCGRCCTFLRPGHHVHDKCWEEYVAQQEATRDNH